MPLERPRYTTPTLPTVELLEDKAETLDAIVALLYAHSTSQVRIEFRNNIELIEEITAIANRWITAHEIKLRLQEAYTNYQPAPKRKK